MAWNEPGKRDPWKGGGKQEPPDMDAMLRRLRERFGGLFGGGGGPSRGGAFWFLIPFLILVWIAFDCTAAIDAQQVGVVLRFGQFNRVMQNGLNLKWPAPIEHVLKVDTRSQQMSDEVRVLTKDENIVIVDFNVQYIVADARQYLFALNQPDETLKQAAEGALRQVIGRSEMDTILSGHGTEVVAETEKVLQQTLDSYHVGLIVTVVNFQKILPPTEVKPAFDDANNAGNNQQQIVNEAQAYAAKVVPLARGEAARVRAEAEGYKQARIANATGEAQRFNLIETQYKAAPEVTRKRLYLETMQGVLSNATKIVDTTNGKNLIYVPVDKAKSEAANAAAAAAAAAAANGGGQ